MKFGQAPTHDHRLCWIPDNYDFVEISGMTVVLMWNDAHLRLPFDKLTILSLPMESSRFQVPGFTDYRSLVTDDRPSPYALLFLLHPALSVPIHPDLPLPHPFLQVALDPYLDGLPRGGKDEGKAGEIGDETRGDKKGAADKEHGPVDQIIPRYGPLLHLPLDVVDDPEPLLPGIVGSQNTGEDNDKNGVKGSYH